MLPDTNVGGQSMAAPLTRVLICSPQTAGWNDPVSAGQWSSLGFRRPPDPARAVVQHEELRRRLAELSIEVVELPPGPGLSMDAVYVHDASFPTDHGMVLMRMGKPARAAEPDQHADLFRAVGIPILGAIEPPGTAEGGDLVWLDERTILAGHGYRTNGAGISQLRGMLDPKGVDVIAAPLPHGPGPDACLHLMSLLSVLADGAMLVDLPWLAVETIELLKSRRFELIEIDPTERDTLACNVLALGERRVLALANNPRTNARLRERGFDVRTFEGSEVCLNGSGGPTCLTRPLVRGR